MLPVLNIMTNVYLCLLTVSLTQAYPRLAPYRPPAQLISPPLLLSVMFNILLNMGIQICGFVLVQKQPWYSTSNFRYIAIELHRNFISHNAKPGYVNQL